MITTRDVGGAVTRERVRTRPAAPELFVELRTRPLRDRTVLGSVLSRSLEPATLLSTPPDPVLRTGHPPVECDPGRIKLMMPVRGSARVAQGDRVCTLLPGDLTLTDLAAAYRVENVEPVELVMLTFPRTFLHDDPDRVRAQAAVRVPSDHSIGGLLGPVLRGLAAQLPHGGVAADDVELAHGVISLLRALYLPRIEPDYGSGTRGDDLLRRVQDYILAHLDSPTLRPEQVAAQHFISTRALYKLFEREGVGVSEWIRTQRLERCRHDLLDATQAEANVLGIATRWGFTSPAHFSRLFKRTYGVSPSEYRRASRLGLAHCWS